MAGSRQRAHNGPQPQVAGRLALRNGPYGTPERHETQPNTAHSASPQPGHRNPLAARPLGSGAPRPTKKSSRSHRFATGLQRHFTTFATEKHQQQHTGNTVPACAFHAKERNKRPKDMEESHNHHHHHAHAHEVKSLNGIFTLSIALNAAFVIIEATVGFMENSLSLMSDAGHNLSDVFSLLLVLVASKLATVQPSKRFTYGLKKSTVLISLLNAIILLVAVGAIILESMHKFREPEAVNGAAVSWTAFAGIIVNGATALLLMRGQKGDINVRGAFLHMAADTLVSVGVVISGIIITLTGWNAVDPVVSLAIAAVILVSTWRLLSESLRLSVDGTPEDIDPDHVVARMLACDHVVNVHHLHIWAMSTTINALTAHVVIDNLEAMEQTKASIKAALKDEGIAHSTIEIETPDCHCADHDTPYGR